MQDKRRWMKNWLYSGRRQQPGQDLNRGQQTMAGRQGGQSQMHRYLQNKQAPLNTQSRAYTQAPSNAAAQGQATDRFYRNRSQEQVGASAPAPTQPQSTAAPRQRIDNGGVNWNTSGWDQPQASVGYRQQRIDNGGVNWTTSTPQASVGYRQQAPQASVGYRQWLNSSPNAQGYTTDQERYGSPPQQPTTPQQTPTPTTNTGGTPHPNTDAIYAYAYSQENKG